MSRIFISATHKSSGKTTVAVGISAALTARGECVQTFKKGPDYIDPLWLARASGRPCYNLDFNTQSHTEILATFANNATAAELALIEGNKGLHDGVDVGGRDSSAALAKLLGCPVILVVDSTGMTRGIAPIVLGHQAFDRDVPIKGVILNRVATSRQETKLRQALERYTDVTVIGAIGRDPALCLNERHLGLTTPGETDDWRGSLTRLRQGMEQSVDLHRLVEMAQGAQKHYWSGPKCRAARRHDVTIGVALDSAFCFYYQDDLEALERAGAELRFFSPLASAHLPIVDGLFIGGGFPETHLRVLEANVVLRREIRAAAEGGLPIYAECGGLMYLTRSIAWRSEIGEMTGVIAADAVMHDRPQGRGLVVLEETASAPWPASKLRTPAGRQIAAHEFHYANLINLDPASVFAYRVLRGTGIDGCRDGIVVANTLASFSHLRDASGSRWADRFVDFVRTCRESRLHRAAS